MLLPLLWRHLFLQYGKTLLLSLAGFLIILLTTRLEEAARLISLGTSIPSVILYILYQIPYVLQIALPISTLIGALYLFQRMSTNNELTAARASGISLFELLAPLLLFSLLVATASFELFFDLSARAHLEAKKLEYAVRETHPLAILQNSRMLESRGVKVDMKGSLVSDRHAQDLIIAMSTGDNGQNTLMLSKKVSSDKDTLHGQDNTVITTKRADDPLTAGELLIENSKQNATSLSEIALVANKHRMWKVGNDLLSLPLLLAKRHELKEKAALKVAEEKSPRSALKKIKKIDAELARRLSLALSIVTFTLAGSAFGCSLGRHARKRRFVYVTVLVSLFLICYLAAKGLEANPLSAMCLYLAPHAVLIAASLQRLFHIQQGVEA